jgi:hypothetical protein
LIFIEFPWVLISIFQVVNILEANNYNKRRSRQSSSSSDFRVNSLEKHSAHYEKFKDCLEAISKNLKVREQ